MALEASVRTRSLRRRARLDQNQRLVPRELGGRNSRHLQGCGRCEAWRRLAWVALGSCASFTACAGATSRSAHRACPKATNIVAGRPLALLGLARSENGYHSTLPSPTPRPGISQRGERSGVRGHRRLRRTVPRLTRHRLPSPGTRRAQQRSRRPTLLINYLAAKCSVNVTPSCLGVPVVLWLPRGFRRWPPARAICWLPSSAALRHGSNGPAGAIPPPAAGSATP